MIKKINLIIFGFFLVLTINLNLGITLLIPIYLYYIGKNIKAAIYLIPSGLLGILIFNRSMLLPYVAVIGFLMLIIVLLITFKNSDIVKRYAYLFKLLGIIACFFLFAWLINEKLPIGLLFLYMLISIAFFTILYLDQSIIFRINPQTKVTYTDQIVALVAILGATTISNFSFSFALIIALYFVMYFSRTSQDILAIVFGIAAFIIIFWYKNMPEGILILLACFLYYNKNPYVFFFYDIVLLCILIVSNIYDQTSLKILMVETIVFELISMAFLDQKLIKKKTYQDLSIIHDNAIKKELACYAGFLEYFASTFKTSKSYVEQTGKALKVINEKHCQNCRKKKECYSNDKFTLCTEFKNMLEKKSISQEFKNYCPSTQTISQTANSLSINMKNSQPESLSLLLAILTGSASILNKYEEYLKSRNHIANKDILIFEDALLSSNELIEKIDYERLFVDDYLIKLTISPSVLYDINSFRNLIINNFPYQSTIEEFKNEGKIIIAIKPIEKFHLTYGYGSLASKKMELCGDNYLVKSFNNGHFLAAISDGMGKGYLAYNDSKRALDAIDALTSCAIDAKTALQILNTLYMLQGYTERYSTIDYVDINRSNYQALFYKLGASSSYIFHEDGSITKIENKCLPLGVEEEVIVKEVILRNNDLVILSSDGIFENIIEEKKFLSLIQDIKKETPQKIAYELLEYTINAKVKVRDDMSIIVLKIESL